MSYVLETTDDNDEIKYISVGECTVYCPEYATRYEDKKSAMTDAALLSKSSGRNNFTVKKAQHKAVPSGIRKKQCKGSQLTLSE